MSDPLRLAVLISGNGSNLQAIIDSVEQGKLAAEICLVLSDRPQAYGLERASRHGIESRIVECHENEDRASYDARLRACVAACDPDYIVLAGFMRILGAEFVAAYRNRILNIHPSLLPAYKGLDTHRRALENRETEHGVSIHLVTAELDDGPLILQGSYPIEAGDSVEDLQQKGHRLEHLMYPRVLSWLASGKLAIDEDRILYEDLPLESALVFNR